MIELDSPRKVVSVTLVNDGETTVTFQSRAVTWQQIDGTDRLTPTDALLVAPAIIDIAPKASQVFRVALRNADPALVERTFRLLLEDVSRPMQGEGQPAVSLRLTHSLPIFVAPSIQGAASLRWSSCGLGLQTNCLRISNGGNRHARIHYVTLRGDGWQRRLDKPATVLAGAWREWKFDWLPTEGAISSITLENDRELFVATREPFNPDGQSIVVAVSEADTDACTSEALKALSDAQVFSQSSGITATERIAAALQSCAGANAASSP